MQKMTHRLTQELYRISHENYDNCIVCGYAFQEGDTSHLGYDLNDKPLHVCDKCSNLLKETVVRYRFSPRSYEIPESNTKLWRYMDFTKYVSLLSSRSLYFTRADCFEDLFEGAKGGKKNKDRWDLHYINFFRDAIKNPPEGHICTLEESEIENQAKHLLNQLENSGQIGKKTTYVSCWHENEYESEAMWRLYSSYLDNAIAVRTTYNRLYESMGCDPSIQIGRIKYIDYNKSYAGINDAFWNKRKSFEHEREVRALVRDRSCEASGKLMKCNLDILIEEVFVSPKAPEWFIGLVNEINEKYSLGLKVSKSELLEEPFF
ncbi:hypothetical protein ABEF79_12065 [Acinetobacter sp. ANC 7454]|uniref:hypothetical protein n=1 Tax=Acinetobacter thermotolerans TaxID=3151487 RepID=UPI00325A8B8F